MPSTINAGTVTARFEAQTAGLRTQIREMNSSLHDMRSSLQSLNRDSVAGFNNVTKAVGQSNSVLERAKGTLAGIAAYRTGRFAVMEAFQGLKTIVIGFNQQMDQANIAMTTMLGDAGKAAAYMRDLQDFAARTPFQFNELVGATQRLMAFGIAAKDVRPTLTAVGDAVAALGGTMDYQGQIIIRALGQINAKGRVTGEEMMQLTEAGISAYEYLARGLNTSVTDVMDKMRKGSIDAASGIKMITAGIEKDMGGMMEAQSKTLMGAISTVKDYVTIIAANSLRPLFDMLKAKANELATFLSSDKMTKIGDRISSSVQAAFTNFVDFANKLKGAWAPFFDGIKEGMGGGGLADFAKRAGEILQHMEQLAVAISRVGAALSGISFEAFIKFIDIASNLLNMVLNVKGAVELLAGAFVMWKALKMAEEVGTIVAKMALMRDVSEEVAVSLGASAMQLAQVAAVGVTGFVAMTTQGTTMTQKLVTGAAAIAGGFAIGGPVGAAIGGLGVLLGGIKSHFDDLKRKHQELVQELAKPMKMEIQTTMNGVDMTNPDSVLAGLDELQNKWNETSQKVNAKPITLTVIDQLMQQGAKYDDIAKAFGGKYGITFSLAAAKEFTRGGGDGSGSLMDIMANALKDPAFAKDVEMAGIETGKTWKDAFDGYLAAQKDYNTQHDLLQSTYDAFQSNFEALKKLTPQITDMKSALDAAKNAGVDLSKVQGPAALQRIVDGLKKDVPPVTNALKDAAEAAKEWQDASKPSSLDMTSQWTKLKDAIKEFTSADNGASRNSGLVAVADQMNNIIETAGKMGGSAAQVQGAAIAMAQQFITMAQAAGLSNAQIDVLLQEMGIVERMKSIGINISVNGVENAIAKVGELAATIQMLKGLGSRFRGEADMAAQDAKDAGNDIGASAQAITEAMNQIRAAASAPISAGKGGGGGGGGAANNPFAMPNDPWEFIKRQYERSLVTLDEVVKMAEERDNKAQAASDVSMESFEWYKKAVEAERRLHDLGQISDTDYLAKLKWRISVTKEGTELYYEYLKEANELEKKIKNDEMSALANKFETGDLSRTEFLGALNKRLSELTKYSAEWMDVWRQIKDVSGGTLGDITKQIKDGLGGAFESIIDPIRSATDIVAAFGRQADVSGDSIKGFYGHMKEGTQRWINALNALKGMGLNQQTLSELVKAGPSSVGFAESLVAIGKTGINDVNSAVSDINGMMAGLGQTVLGNGAVSVNGDQVNITLGDVTLTIPGFAGGAPVTPDQVKQMITDALRELSKTIIATGATGNK